MKNILTFFFLLPIVVFAQAPTPTENYVRTKVYKTPTTSSITAPNASQALQTVSYVDGLGRPIQIVVNQQSGTGKNIVVPIEYDAYGRQLKRYLPYTTQSNGLSYESNALSDVLNYAPYQGQNPYNEAQFDNSPLNKVMMQASPGTDWAMGSGHEIKLDYMFNEGSGNNAVKLFRATATWNSTKGLYDTTLLNATGGVYYAANELYKTVTKNENWTSGTNNITESFVDKNGKMVLKRMFENFEILDTYYVYDQFGNLTYMIPPKADMAISQTILDKLCYQYKYDNRNRLVEKKLPGKQWEFIVYDKLNRVVATGPTFPPFSNLTQAGWMITKYDIYNRPVLTGWMSSASTINSALRKTRQDDRNNETTNFSESRTSSTPDVTISGIMYRYTNLAIPTSGYHVLTVNYYDDYNYTDAPTIPSSVEGQPVFFNNTVKPKGLVTGQWIRASKTSTSYRGELKYMFYDSKSRPIRVYMRNHEIGNGGFTQIDSKFNFIGQAEYTIATHKRIGSDTAILVKDFYTYTDQNRLLTHTHQVNSGAIQLMEANTYDELGRLISKGVGNTTNSPLQKVDYSYNIKGWLTGINDITNLVQSGAPNDLFAFKINYNTVQNDLNAPVIAKLYNGNISETYWRTSSDNVLRKYAYKYDDLNRLRVAYYRLPNSSSPSAKTYDENASYDKNGNIMSMRRTGNVEIISPPIEIDDLSYTYETDSNRLLKVTEATPTAISGFKDGSNTGDDYNYDANGNMITDANKGITAIQYNHQNLPLKITFGTTGTIEYLYDALGRKLEKTVTVGTAPATTTKYLEGFQYVIDVLQFFPTTEGYVAKQGSTYKYVFQYKDHLGNVRLSYAKNATTGNLDIIEESHYYPFGMKHSGYNSSINLANGNSEAQKYKFQEQERQEELGLNWDSFKWRNYDYAIGRFMSVDPLAEKYNWQSNYAFGSNQVIHSREIEGLEAENDFNYEDGDDHAWNAGLVGNDYFDHTGEIGFTPVGFDNNWTNDPNDMFPKDGHLDEVVVGNNYKEGYDKNGVLDGNEDSYDREQNEEALENMARTYQNIGTVLTVAGAFLSVTGIGAPIGMGLMAIGAAMSTTGISIDIVEDAFDDEDGFDWGSHAMDVGTAIVPELYGNYFDVRAVDDLMIGGDRLMIELGAAGSDVWMDYVIDLHK